MHMPASHQRYSEDVPQDFNAMLSVPLSPTLDLLVRLNFLAVMAVMALPPPHARGHATAVAEPRPEKGHNEMKADHATCTTNSAPKEAGASLPSTATDKRCSTEPGLLTLTLTLMPALTGHAWHL